MHGRKKPSGINAVLEYLKCEPDKLVMFGDRVYTDIVFGNFNGMLTVLTQPFTHKNDVKTASNIRRNEIELVKKLISEGYHPPKHDMVQ